MRNRNRVVKLNDRKIRYIVREKIKNRSSKRIAAEMKVSVSTVKRVWMHYLRTKELISIKKFGRPRKEIEPELEDLILEVHKEQNLGARRLEQIIEFKYGVHIPHNAIHRVLLKHNLAQPTPNKKRRRKPWIRYEREHSLTAVHIDWHDSDAVPGKKVCALLDDSSRFILAGIETDHATADQSIGLVQRLLAEYGNVRMVEEIISDHGSQFHANKKDKNGNSESRFETFLTENSIKHIKGRIKHPQTNGKFEKWNDTYEKNRIRFQNFDNFVNWYNTVRYHEALDTDHYLQTPWDAFWSRLPPACILRVFIDRMERELS